MSDRVLVKRYIFEVVTEELLWYERDGLLTYIDQLKCKRFMSDKDRYIEKGKEINFDMIYVDCDRALPQQYSNRHYQTVQSSEIKKMSQKDRKKAVSACL